MKKVIYFMMIMLFINNIALVSFIVMSASAGISYGRYAVAAIAIIGNAWLIWRAAKLLPFIKLIMLGVFAAIGSVLTQQVVGFLFFPGIVKDVDMFSLYHAEIFLKILSLLLVFYVSIIISIHAINLLRCNKQS